MRISRRIRSRKLSYRSRTGLWQLQVTKEGPSEGGRCGQAAKMQRIIAAAAMAGGTLNGACENDEKTFG